MKDALALAGIFIFALVIGAISNELGITQTGLAESFQTPPSPGSGIFDALGYAFDAATAFFQIITYRVSGINPMLSTILLLAFGGATLWLVARLIRGGG